VTDTEHPPELRLKSSSRILNYMRQFSSTEKAIFGVLCAIVFVSAVVMAGNVNVYFMTSIPSYGGNLKEGTIGLPHTINPVLAVTDVDRDISSLVFSGLLKYRDGALALDAAQGYKVSPDGLTYTFTIRPNAQFQDGTKLTASDIAFTIQKIQDTALKSPRRTDFVNVTVKVLSDSQVQFVLKQPYSPFLTTMTLGILPKHIWESVSDDQFIFSQYNIEPVGSGPYRESSVERDSGGIPVRLSLTAWSGYYGAIPHLSTITFHFFADQDAALSALDSGTIDSLPAVSADQAARLSKDKAQAYTVLATTLPRIFGVFFNQSQNPALADKSVRQALDMTVDRPSIIKNVLHGYGLPIQGPLPPLTPTARPGSTATSTNTRSSGISQTGLNIPIVMSAYSTSSLAVARALLERNGWSKDASGVYQKSGPKNTSVPLAFDIYTADNIELKAAAEIVKNSWNALGARVTVKVFESSDLYQNIIRTRKYDALLFGELIGKDRDIYAFWHSSQRNSPGLNVSMYTNATVDSLLEDIRSQTDDHTRAADYAELDRQIRTDIPAVFLYSPDFLYVVPKVLRGVSLGSVTVPSDRFGSINDWYITTERVWRIFARNNN